MISLGGDLHQNVPMKKSFLCHMSEVIYVSSGSESDSSDIELVGVCSCRANKFGYCRICQQNLISMMTYPCYHAAVCLDCFDNLPEPKKCPTCGAKITKHEFFILS